MGLKQILQNFSWDALISLPPSELLSLVVLVLLAGSLLVWAVLVGLSLADKS
jgi:hypothetical protein